MKNFTQTFSLFVVFLMCSYLSHGQAQLGNGTNTEQQLPLSAHYENSYGQSIYLATEIGIEGDITSLKWYYNGNFDFATIENITISLGNTSKSEFISLSDWETDENLTQVYQGGLIANAPGWVTIELDIPFSYNGTDNLVVAVKKTSINSGTASDKFFNAQVSTNRSLVSFCNLCTLPSDNTTPANTLSNYVPNIILGNIDLLCPSPALLSVQDITGSSATLNWQQPAIPSHISNEYYISTSNSTPNATTTSGTVESGDVISNLEINTTYFVWLRNNCVDGPGPWTFASSFTTSCGVLDTFSEDLEEVPLQTLPLCWSSILREGADTSAYVKTMSGNAKSGTNSIHMVSSNSAVTSDIILVSPSVGPMINTHRLKFSAKGLPAGILQIGTLNGSGDGSEFTLFQEQAITNVHTEYIINFASYTGDDTHVGFRMNTQTPYTNVYLDDIRWEVTPPCMDVSLVSVPVATPLSATVNWEAGTGITEWDIVYGTENETDPNTLLDSLIEVTGNPGGLISELSPSTTYNVWVRTVCTGGNGVWIGPVTFTTACLAVNQITENFDGVAAPLLPACWSAIKRGNNNAASATIATDAADSNSGPNAVKINNNFANTGTDDIILVSPNIGNLAAGTHRLRFFAKDNGNGALQIVTLNSATNDAAFTVFQTIQTSGTYTEYKVDFTAYEGEDSFIGFRNGFGSYESVFIDNVSWELAPACPDATEINFDSISSNTTSFSWDSSTTAPNWDIVFDTAPDTDPGTLTVQNSTTTEATLTDLNESTTYYLWLRSDCGEQTGDWNGPFKFTTACEAVTSLNEGFEGIGTDLPSCWSTILRGPSLSDVALVMNIDADAITGTNSIVMYNEPNYTIDDLILVTPYLSNIASGTATLKFNAYQVVFFIDMKIVVGTLNNNSPSAIFTPFEVISLTDAAQEHTVDFSAYSGTDSYIGFRYSTSDDGSGMIYLDDIKWDSDLGVKEQLLPNINYYPNPVTDILNLSSVKNISAVAVYNLLGQKVMETVASSTSTQVQMSGLAAGSYIVKITSDNQTDTIKVIKR